MMQLFGNSKFGFCGWDIIALLVLVLVAVVYFYKVRKIKKEREELEEAITQFNTGEAMK